jgi:hypothetical protein
MKKELPPVIIGLVLVVLVVLAGSALWYYSNPHTPAGVKYTPGVPPWMEKGAKAGYQPYALPKGAPAPSGGPAMPPSTPSKPGA